MSQEKTTLARVALLQKRVAGTDVSGPSPEQVQCRLQAEHGVEPVDLGAVRIPLELLQMIPREIAERHRLLPVKLEHDALYVAMQAPGDRAAIDELSFVVGREVRPLVVAPDELERALVEAYLAAKQGERVFRGWRCRASSDGPGAPSDPEFVPLQPSVDPPSVSPDAGAAPRSGALVLVVDDDPAVQRLMTRWLHDAGHRVVTARDGAEAILVLKEQRPDLLVLDAMLPGVHGFELVRRLHSSRRFSHVPIVMVSALHRGWELARDLRRYGVVRYLEKPFKPQRFLRAVGAALGIEPPALRTEAVERLQAGLAAFAQGDPDGATSHLAQAIALEPDDPTLHLHLGLVLGQLGRTFEAISSLERSLELGEGDFTCSKNLAVLYQQAGFEHKTLESWQRALDSAPDEQTRASIRERLRALSGY